MFPVNIWNVSCIYQVHMRYVCSILQDLVVSLGLQTRVSTVLEPLHMETDFEDIELIEEHGQHGVEKDPLEDLRKYFT